MLTFRAIVAITSLTVYLPTLPTCLYIAHAQGPGHNSAYVYLALFACIRITGFSLQLYAETSDQTANTSIYTGVAVLLNIGLSPLLLTAVGLLSRVDGAIGRRMGWMLVMVGVPIFLALALLIAGSIDPTSQEGPTFSANGEIKTAVALYLFCSILLCYATALIVFRKYLANKDDQKLVFTVIVSLPFLLVRVLYIVLFAFHDHGNSEWFNVISGDETTQLCMQVVEEYCVVFLYLLVGLTLSRKWRHEEGAVLAEAAYAGGKPPEKRGRVSRALRYVPLLYWFLKLREVSKASMAALEADNARRTEPESKANGTLK